MIKGILKTWVFILTLALATPLYAVDINLINVDMSPDDNDRLTNAYSKAYGYSPQQVAPTMYGPPEEVPAILQIAQAAGQVPMTVWMMRRMGMNYGSILSTFALAPTALMGSARTPYGYPQPYPSSPGWNQWMDPFYVQTARVNFLTNVLRVPRNLLGSIPVLGLPFARSLVYPYHPVHGTWLPPGIAKKYGLWIPPGQRKKIGWGPWGGGPNWKSKDWKKGSKHGWKHEAGKGGGPKHGWKQENGKGQGKGKQKISKADKGGAQYKSKGKGNSSKSWGGSSKGGGNGGGKGKKK
ncbi:MAG: hypothetical protein R3257_02670 [bacterium]|nr:hypothetical protein [bacterium]